MQKSHKSHSFPQVQFFFFFLLILDRIYSILRAEEVMFEMVTTRCYSPRTGAGAGAGADTEHDNNDDLFELVDAFNQWMISLEVTTVTRDLQKK